MAESADRSLPMAAVIKLSTMEALYAHMIEKETAAQIDANFALPPSPTETVRRSKPDRQADKLSYRAYTAQNKLTKMQKQYRQALNSWLQQCIC